MNIIKVKRFEPFRFVGQKKMKLNYPDISILFSSLFKFGKFINIPMILFELTKVPMNQESVY